VRIGFSFLGCYLLISKYVRLLKGVVKFSELGGDAAEKTKELRGGRA
jgi:hypothetical protein